MTEQAKRLGLGEVGALSAGERAIIKEWLVDNFCTEETFECTLKELKNGGFSLEDSMDALGEDDDAFGVHVLEARGDRPAVLVVLFEVMPQGILIDRASLKVIGEVIEGALGNVSAGYEVYIPAIREAVPTLGEQAGRQQGQGTEDDSPDVDLADDTTTKKKGRRTPQPFSPPADGPQDVAGWRARYPEPKAQRTIDVIVSGLEELRGYGEESLHHSRFEDDLGIPVAEQPTDAYLWLCQVRRLALNDDTDFGDLPFEDVRPLENFKQLKCLRIRTTADTDLSPLGNFEQLTELLIEGGERSDWAWLSRLSKLEELRIDSSEPEDARLEKAPRFSLANLTKLKEFYWTGNYDDISHLGLGPQLEKLGLPGKSVSDISSLAGLTALEELSLVGCEVRDLTPLSGLVNLASLDIRRNQVVDLSPLASRRFLALKADYNCISDFQVCRVILRQLKEAEEWIEKTSRTQLRLTTPEAHAVYDDWLNLDKWRRLADVLLAAGDPMGEQIRLRLANDPACELPRFWARGTMTNDPSWK